MPRPSVEFLDELADAYDQAGAACEMYAGDFPAGSPCREAHMHAAKRLYRLAIATTMRARNLEAKP